MDVSKRCVTCARQGTGADDGAEAARLTHLSGSQSRIHLKRQLGMPENSLLRLHI
jgi:hypothetical protein